MLIRTWPLIRGCAGGSGVVLPGETKQVGPGKIGKGMSLNSIPTTCFDHGLQSPRRENQHSNPYSRSICLSSRCTGSNARIGVITTQLPVRLAHAGGRHHQFTRP